MDYELIISERADELTDCLVAYLLNNLNNPGAAAHFLDELETIYDRLINNPYQFLIVRMNTCSCADIARHCSKPCTTRLFTVLKISRF